MFQGLSQEELEAMRRKTGGGDFFVRTINPPAQRLPPPAASLRAGGGQQDLAPEELILSLYFLDWSKTIYRICPMDFFRVSTLGRGTWPWASAI